MHDNMWSEALAPVLTPSTGLGPKVAGFEDVLRDEIARTGLPGAVIGVCHAGETVFLSAGVEDLSTGVACGAETLFPLACLMKPIIATLLMQLADAGRLDLDAPVAAFLPGFVRRYAGQVCWPKVRDLLCHTSGIEDGADRDLPQLHESEADYVRRARGFPQIAPPGEMFSFGRIDTILAAGVAMRVLGVDWRDALNAGLLRDLGAEVRFLDDVAGYRGTASEHVRTAAGQFMPVQPAYAPAMDAAGGGRVRVSARSLIAFASLHVGGGPRGLMSPTALAQMQQPQMPLVLNELAQSCALGWMVRDDGVICHTGSTPGATSAVYLIPKRGLALVALTNGNLWRPHPPLGGLCMDLLHAISGERIAPRVAVSPPPRRFPVGRLLGDYEGYGRRLEVREAVAEDEIEAVIGETDGAPGARRTIRLRDRGDGVFTAVEEGELPFEQLGFLCRDASGRPTHVHNGWVLAARVR